jgi:DNA polymerase IV
LLAENGEKAFLFSKTSHTLIHMESGRQIIHLDLDAFYASVEQQDYPELRGLPVVVGGSMDRGVVCACSYEARRYGIRSAMAMAKALQLCPQAIVRQVRMERYRQLSRKVFAIFSRFTDRIEPLSVDEAFLDVSDCEKLFGSAVKIAEAIRTAVREETGLVISAGIAPNKFLAKLASAHGKPDGLFVVPNPPDAFLLGLPLESLWGVGPVTLERLKNQGLRSIADLRRCSRERLMKLFGVSGDHLYHLCRGIDPRSVETATEAKSIGHEDTCERDLWEREKMHQALLDLAERVGARLRRKGLVGFTVTLKIRYADFTSVSRSRTLSSGLDHAMDIYRIAVELLDRTVTGQQAVRLLGISLGRLQNSTAVQGELFDATDRRRLVALDDAVDRLRQRYGFEGVRRASLLEAGSGAKSGSEDVEGPQ